MNHTKQIATRFLTNSLKLEKKKSFIFQLSKFQSQILFVIQGLVLDCIKALPSHLYAGWAAFGAGMGGNDQN